MILTKKSVNRHLLRPLKKLGYKIKLVGSIAIKQRSDKDIDLLLYLPKYPKSNKMFRKFEKDLKTKLKWNWHFSGENDNYGVLHNYQKRGIGLDIFINEKY